MFARRVGVLILAAIAACGDDGPGGSGSTDQPSTGEPSTSGSPSTSGPGSNSGTSSPGTSETSGETEATTTPDTDDDTSESSSTGEPPPVDDVHLIGRFDAELNSTWSGSTMRTRIDGTTIDIDLDGSGGVIFQVVVDGQPTSTFTTSGGAATYPVASGLAAGEHDIEVVRRNEGYFGPVRYVGFVPGTDTTLVETPWPYEHRIEYIGDSLTAGYGIECSSGSDGFTPETESAYSTYAMTAARQVNAAPHVIAFSGKGVFQNYGGNLDEPMPVLYPRTLTTDGGLLWDFSSFVPGAVVINLGTNDFSAAIAMDDFVGAYVALLQTVRTNHPSALIICVTWAHWGSEHEGWVQAAMDQVGDGNTITTRFEILGEEGAGCDGHTNEVTNARFGMELAALLSSELGW